jgi:hypothetical protein
MSDESLYEIITRRQDELRGRPLTKWERFAARFKYVDWIWVGFCICVVLWGVSQILVVLAR